MKNYRRYLLVLFKNGQAMDQESECLREILFEIYTSEQFFIANELVDRYRITSNRKKMVKESAYMRLRAFRFFINKN
jgi:hypothetical protein